MDEYVCLAAPRVELDTGLLHVDYIRHERVTRCRDCRFCKRSTPVYIADGKTYTGDFWLCEAVCETEWPGHRFQVSPDGFCAWGEPREEDE